MKNLFLVMHGEFNPNELSLNSRSIVDLQEVGRLIKERGDSDFYILSSPEILTVLSAGMLASSLGLSTFENRTELWSGNFSALVRGGNYSGNPEIVHKLVQERKDKASSLVLMSHYEVGASYPTYFVNNEFETSAFIDPLQKCQGIYFDLNRKRFERLSA